MLISCTCKDQYIFVICSCNGKYSEIFVCRMTHKENPPKVVRYLELLANRPFRMHFQYVLFNIHESKKIKSFKVLSMISFYGYHSNGISVTKSGDLIYCCSLYNTVNTVVAERINILISLQDWSPRGVCNTSEGDMLISMTHKENPPKVVCYSGIVDKQTIQYDAEGKPLFLIDDCLYLAENKT